MNLKLLPLGAAAATAMALACLPASADTVRPRTIAVSGQAYIQAEPDQALLTLGVESHKVKMEDARAEVNRTVDAVLKLTRELKIDQKYVSTTRISVRPEYNWDNEARERNLIGYFVSRQVQVDLRDLEKLGTLLERSLDLGVNQAGDPRLDSSKRRDLEREALAQAVADAKLNAEAVARAAGGRVGAPRSISASGGYAPPPMPMMRAMAVQAEAASAADSYQSGEMSFNASVQVEYDLIVD